MNEQQRCAICEDSGKFIAMLSKVETTMEYLKNGQIKLEKLLSGFIDKSDDRIEYIARKVAREELDLWDQIKKKEKLEQDKKDLAIKKFEWGKVTWAVGLGTSLILSILSFLK